MFKHWFMALKAAYVAHFCYTITVPEYRGFHVARNIRELMSWRHCYPVDAKVLITTPIRF